MSNSSGSWKTAVGVVIVLVLIGVGTWYFSRSSSAPQTAQAPATTAPATTAPQAPAPVVPAAVSDVQSRDASNASLDLDAAAIDSQMSLLSSDSSQVDKSINDTPVTQAQ